MNDIYSMTGFGRSEALTEDYHLLVEIKSVNHRYLDLQVKMPRIFNSQEAMIRSLLKEYMERGKTDLYITFENYAGSGSRLVYNRALAADYMRCFGEIAEEFGLKNEISAPALGHYADVLTMEENSIDEDTLRSMLEPVLREALTAFRQARACEGENLRRDMLDKLAEMDREVAQVEAASPSVVESYRKRLYERIRETLSDASIQADEGRIVTEVAIYSDKVCTDEEMTRLKSHISTMRRKLEQGGACGRELDFIAQEMNREANTTLSKASSLEIADVAIQLKTNVEKIREQVQNIE